MIHHTTELDFRLIAPTKSYCGPAILAGLTGCTTADASELFRLQRIVEFACARPGRQVKGTSSDEMKLALLKLNIGMKQMRWSTVLGGHKFETISGDLNSLADRSTVKNWADATAKVRDQNVYLIAAGKHWRMVKGWHHFCGIKGRTSVPGSHKPNTKIAGVWELFQKDHNRDLPKGSHGFGQGLLGNLQAVVDRRKAMNALTRGTTTIFTL